MLPTYGTISYTTDCGTYTFGAFARSTLRMDPVPSRSRTTTRGVKYTLTVDDLVVSPSGTGGDEIDTEMTSWARILTARCGRLVYSGRGHDLDVNNPAGEVRDIGGSEGLGPIPHLSEMRPMGVTDGAIAAKVSWSCTTIIPVCCVPAAYSGRLSDFSYEISWRIDDGGRQTRTISGALEIPVTRLGGNRTPTDQADRFRDRIEKAFPMMEGFKRTRDFKLGDDRRTEMFTVVDREVDPTAFQTDMENWHGEQNTRSTLKEGFKIFANRISATFVVQKDKEKALAWERFGAIVGSRLLGAARAKNPNLTLWGAINEVLGDKSLSLMPLELDVRDSLHSQEASFSFSYRHTTNPIFFLRQCGMWRPLPNGKWEDWWESAKKGAARERGYAGLAYNQAFDAIIDLCAVGKGFQLQPLPGGGFNLPRHDFGGGGFGLPLPPQMGGKAAGEHASRPPRESSFLAYEAHLRFIGIAGIARHKPLHYAPSSLAPVHETDTNVRTHLQHGSAPPDVLQSVSSPTCTIILYGSAVRAGYAVVPPRLLSVGGVPATLVEEDIDNAEIGSGGGISIFGGRWQCVYLLTQTPSGDIPVPVHPFFPDQSGGPERV